MKDTKLRSVIEDGCDAILDALEYSEESKDQIDYEMHITKMMLICKSMMLACKESMSE